MPVAVITIPQLNIDPAKQPPKPSWGSDDQATLATACVSGCLSICLRKTSAMASRPWYRHGPEVEGYNRLQ